MRIAVPASALAALLSFPAHGAEVHKVPDCAGDPGIGIATYVKHAGQDIQATARLTEVCWDAEAAALSAVESSGELEKTEEAGHITRYQRLAGGAVSPVNEQLVIGGDHPVADSPVRYFRWTTENSRSREELGGHDYVSIEGYLAGAEGFSGPPDSVAYDVTMLLTAVDGPPMSMVFNMIVPMEGTLTVENGISSLAMTAFEPGMGPGEITLEASGSDGEAQGRIAMTNGLMAGAMPQMWQTIEAELETMLARFSGNETAFVASYKGEAMTSGGDPFPLTLTLTGRGAVGN